MGSRMDQMTIMGFADADNAVDSLFEKAVLPILGTTEVLRATGASVVEVETDLGTQEYLLGHDEYGNATCETPENDELLICAVDVDELYAVISSLVRVVRSESYISGRQDQLEDLLGTNIPRTVKARELGAVYDNAKEYHQGDDFTEGGKKAFLEVMASLRNSIRLVPVEGATDEFEFALKEVL